MAAKDKTIQIRISDKLLSRFEVILDREGLTKTQVLTQAVHDFIKANEKSPSD